jgi:hypothetical protein
MPNNVVDITYTGNNKYFSLRFDVCDKVWDKAWDNVSIDVGIEFWDNVKKIRVGVDVVTNEVHQIILSHLSDCIWENNKHVE